MNVRRQKMHAGWFEIIVPGCRFVEGSKFKGCHFIESTIEFRRFQYIYHGWWQYFARNRNFGPLFYPLLAISIPTDLCIAGRSWMQALVGNRREVFHIHRFSLHDKVHHGWPYGRTPSEHRYLLMTLLIYRPVYRHTGRPENSIKPGRDWRFSYLITDWPALHRISWSASIDPDTFFSCALPFHLSELLVRPTLLSVNIEGRSNAASLSLSSVDVKTHY